MEMQNSKIMKKRKLGVFDILKEALTISTKNIDFLIYTLLISLPLFLFLVYYEILLQTTLVEIKRILTPPPGYYYDNWPIPQHISKKLGKDVFGRLIQLFILYLVPLQLLDLCNVIATVDLASRIYAQEKSMTFKEMVLRPVQGENLRQVVVTSLYVVALSTCTLLPMIWFATNYYIAMFGHSESDAFFAVIFGVMFVLLLAKYLDWSVVWNISIVVSILEEKVYGAEALALSTLFTKGSNKQEGRLLMLVFFAWGLGSTVLCLYDGCYRSGYGIIIGVGLFCSGNVVKWIACLIYLYDCKRQKLEKKVDLEIAGDYERGNK